MTYRCRVIKQTHAVLLKIKTEIVRNMYILSLIFKYKKLYAMIIVGAN